MNLLIYKEDQRINKAEAIIDETNISIDAPDQLLAELLNFDWDVFTYCYKNLLDLNGPVPYVIRSEMCSQLLLLTRDCRNALYHILFDAVEVAEDYIFFDDEGLDKYTLPPIPLSKEILTQLNTVTYLIPTIESSIKDHHDYDWLQYILYFAYGYNHIERLYYPQKISAVLCFDIIQHYLFPSINHSSIRRDSADAQQISTKDDQNFSNSSYAKFKTEITNILSTNDNQEFLKHFEALTNIVSEIKHGYNFSSLLDDCLWVLQKSSDSDVPQLLSLFVENFCNYTASCSNKYFKSQIARRIYATLNTPPYPPIPEVYECNSLSDLLCCLTLSFYKQQTPLAICQYCQKIFVRTANSQKNCKNENCQKLAHNSGKAHSLALFGRDLFCVLNNVYKRLCYSGTGTKSKYDTSKYCGDGVTLSTSEEIVESFSKLKKEYVKELNQHISTIWGLPEFARDDYIDLVNEWINQIDAYYRCKYITALVDKAVNDNTHPKEKKAVVVKRFGIDPSFPFEIITSDYRILE